MKKVHSLFSVLALVCFSTISNHEAQAQCGDRYQTQVFDAYTLIPQVPYGMNTNVAGVPQTLFMDIYQPPVVLDTVTKRPLLITAFGGSFAYGDKKSPDLLIMIEKYVKMGYVCASFDYRLLYETLPPDQFMAIKAVLRAVQDGKAAIRYLKKNADMYGIDTSKIAMIGVSAGGFIALHNQFLDKPEELTGYMTPAQLDSMGGLEGNSGNPGYSSKVNAIVNLCGALGKASWMDNDIVPVYSMHGTADGTVPYDRDTIALFGSTITVVDGSYAIDTFARNNGLTNHELYTWEGAGHTPFVPLYPVIGDQNWQKYMDTVFMKVTPFLYEKLTGCTFTAGMSEKKGLPSLAIYPNPVTEHSLRLAITESSTFSLYDLQGRLICQKQVPPQELIQLDKNIDAGLYVVQVQTATQQYRSKIIIN